MYTLNTVLSFTTKLYCIIYYSLKSCSGLEELDLSSNDILTRLPDVFGAMSSLRSLDVSGCSLAALPERYVYSNSITRKSVCVKYCAVFELSARLSSFKKAVITKFERISFVPR